MASDINLQSSSENSEFSQNKLTMMIDSFASSKDDRFFLIMGDFNIEPSDSFL